MLAWKVLALLVATGAQLLHIALGDRWRDRRTKKHRYALRALPWAVIVSLVVAVVILVYDHRSQEQAQGELRQQLANSETGAEKREAGAKKERASLNERIGVLSRSLEPFVEVALQRYPRLGPSAALSKLADDVTELERKTAQLETRANAIHSMEIHVLVDLPTLPSPQTGKATSAGLQSVVAFFDESDTRYRFVTDFQFSHQQVDSTTYRLMFVYRPESQEQIFGRPIKSLTGMQKFVVDYSGFLREIRIDVDQHSPATMHVSTLVNGVVVVQLENRVADLGVLSNGQVIMDVAESFAEIPARYVKSIAERATDP